MSLTYFLLQFLTVKRYTVITYLVPNKRRNLSLLKTLGLDPTRYIWGLGSPMVGRSNKVTKAKPVSV